MDKLKKEFRVLEDEYLGVKAGAEAEREGYEREVGNLRARCEARVREIEERLEKEYELKVGRRVGEVERECEQRVRMYQGQL